MKKRIRLLFILAVLLCLLFPFAALPFSPEYPPTQDSDLAAFPSLITDAGWNQNYLSELGNYFEDHFAFRQHLISINGTLHEKLFRVSASEQVVLGKNGWMYYAGTLDDYLVRDTMSDRAVQNAAHNLKLLQDYVENRGSRFLLAIAPNKNAVYDENMPYYYRRGSGENNLDRLSAALSDAGVHLLDLREVFAKQKEILYLPQDSHWNNQGAALVYQQIMRRLGLPFTDYAGVPYERRTDHNGDLAQLIYPLGDRLEENIYYQKDWSYRYVGDGTDPMDAWIETAQPAASHTLLFYRDSFGSSLIPFFSDSFASVYYSRLVPYNLANVDQYHPDYTVLERAQRTIAAFATQPAIMQAPGAQITATGEQTTDTTLSIQQSGGYDLISGRIDHKVVTPDSDIYLMVTDENGSSAVYQAFHVTVQTEDETDDYGYCAYLDKRTVSAGSTVSVLVADQTGCISVKTESVEL